MENGVRSMNNTGLRLLCTGLLLVIPGLSYACDYTAGETKFLDYATCRYGEDNIQQVDLPENAAFDSCVYQVEPFRPSKLLAVTREENGKEVLSLNDRHKIGNPCYLTKSACDRALRTENGY